MLRVFAMHVIILSARLWSSGVMILTREAQVYGENPALMPLRLPQILYGVTWDQTRALLVRGQRPVARP